jgi:hypothetical protein
MRFFCSSLIYILLFSGYSSYALKTKKITISFIPLIDSISLTPTYNNRLYQSGDSLTIETFRFYISDIKFCNNNQLVWTEPASFHLIDASVPASLILEFNIPNNIKSNEIQYNLGIDSVTNVSGVKGGDLDPSKGMYWTWQSGYINFKLEGTNKRCPSRKNEFQFHLGGYASTFSAIQHITLKTPPTEHIYINTNIAPFLSNIDITKQYSIMIPGQQAVELSLLAKGIFSIR